MPCKFFRVGIVICGWLGCFTFWTVPAAEAGPNDTRFASAQWITPPTGHDLQAALPLFRKEFHLDGPVHKATLRIIGLGDYDARMNGRRLASTGINQPWSQYERTVYYRDYDITALLQPENNCLGVMLTNSFWHNQRPPQGRYYKDGPQRTASEPLRLLAEICLETDDGNVRRIGTDTSWRTHPGPITFSHIFAGEDYDARQRQIGWDLPGFDASQWKPARVVPVMSATLRPQFWPSIGTHQSFAPTSISEPVRGVWLYTFPQNCSAQVRIKVSGGNAGDRITLTSGEHKSAAQRLFGPYLVDCELITDGQPLAHQWISFYVGMQFLEISGAVPLGRPNPDGLPVIESVKLIHVRTALPEVGAFECSSELLNDTHRIIDWAIRSNMSHVLTDCPHREKLGWLEVTYLLAPSLEYRYDCRGWFEKIMQDIRDAQEPTGRVLTVAPSYPAGRFPDKFNWSVEWGAAAVMLPWQQYEWTGDTVVLRKNFDTMRRFVEYIESEAQDGLAPAGLGDWYDYGHGQPPGPAWFTPPQLSATATWAICAAKIAEAARILQRPDEARRFEQLHQRLVTHFRLHFCDTESGNIVHQGSPQCANAMALCAELVPAGDRPRLVKQIMDDLRQRDWQQTPGDIGHVYLIRALAEAGRSDVLHRVYSRDGAGSYGGVLKKGLTCMPETWDAMMDGYQSLNHCMLGHVIEWLYGYVAGIRQRPGTVGWKDVLIAPTPGPLTHAKATLTLPSGAILSCWQVRDGQFHLRTQISQGLTATAILPSGAIKRLHHGMQEFIEPYQVSPEVLPAE